MVSHPSPTEHNRLNEQPAEICPFLLGLAHFFRHKIDIGFTALITTTLRYHDNFAFGIDGIVGGWLETG